MNIYIVYSIVVFVATTIGSGAGLGGGVIIKPLLDFIGAHDISTISFISTSSVFAMSLYSSITQLRKNTQFKYKIALLVATGAAIGGVLGNQLFSILLNIISEDFLKFIQSMLLIFLLVYVYMNGKRPTYLKVTSEKISLVIGLILGMLSSFLGIGGGPINVAVFVMLFSMNFKEATIYSLVTILFSQGTKLFTIYMTTGFGKYDCSLLYFLIPIAILGGIVGVRINRVLSSEKIQKIFNSTVIFIILINICNILQVLF